MYLTCSTHADINGAHISNGLKGFSSAGTFRRRIFMKLLTEWQILNTFLARQKSHFKQPKHLYAWQEWATICSTSPASLVNIRNWHLDVSELIQSHVTRGIVWGALQQARFHHNLQNVFISTPSIGSLAPWNHLEHSQEDLWLLGGGGSSQATN